MYKKFRIILLIFLVSISLISCRSDRGLKLSIESWAMYYAVEKFEETGFTALAIETVKLAIIPEWLIKDSIDTEVNNYDYKYLKVTVYSNEGSAETYLIFIIYEEPLFFPYFYEDKIINVEIERQKDV